MSLIEYVLIYSRVTHVQQNYISKSNRFTVIGKTQIYKSMPLKMELKDADDSSENILHYVPS